MPKRRYLYIPTRQLVKDINGVTRTEYGVFLGDSQKPGQLARLTPDVQLKDINPGDHVAIYTPSHAFVAAGHVIIATRGMTCPVLYIRDHKEVSMVSMRCRGAEPRLSVFRV